MPKILKDEEGNDVEVSTPEELDAEQAKAVAAKEVEIKTKYEADLKAKEEEIVKLTGKAGDFASLREAKEKLEADKKVVEEKYQKDIADLNLRLTEGQQKEIVDYKSQLFSALAGKDDELKKKIEYHYAHFTDAATADKKVIDKLANDALMLAMGEVGTVVLNGSVVRSGGGSPIKPGEIPSHLLPHAKAMGMTEDEFVKNFQKAKAQGLIKE